MNRIIVHIGAPKCGSTFLQRVLLKNQKRLHGSRIGYPHIGSGHPGNGLSILAPTGHWLDELGNRFDTLILSHEDLFSQMKKTKRFQALTRERGIDVQIWALLRPFSEIVFGDISQMMKQRFQEFVDAQRALDGRNFRQFVWARHKDIAADHYLSLWQDAFPEHPLRLDHTTDISSAFKSICPQAPELDWSLPKWQTNPSLTVQACEEAIELVRSGCRGEQAKALLSQSGPSGRKKDFGRTHARQEWIEAVFAPRTQALRTTFGFDNRLERQ